MKKILVDGGYYDCEKEEYFFYIQDHLGNNRVVANSNDSVVQRSDYYPFGMEFADNTNSEEQPYKYNGKELDKMLGLNMYDYSARYVDPAYGRFTSVDPLAEIYYNVSPYVYVKNNPLKYIDPTGMYSTQEWKDDHGIKDDDLITVYRATTDAGHGDKPKDAKQVDPGAVDGSNYEKDYALKVESQVDYHLRKLGVDNHRTRKGDVTVDGKRVIWRYKLANAAGSEVLISIHLDSGAKPGLFSIYREGNSKSKALADYIASQIQALPLNGNGTKEDTRGLGLLRGFKGDAAVIIELGGIGNKQTIDAINSNASQIGLEIARGIVLFLKKNRPGAETISNWF